MTSGLRERRKQETRQAISDIATRLFVAHGFDEVTISQVADAAGVAKMTVTNYFPRKEDLVFDRAETVIGHLAEVVAARKAGESMLAAIRRDYAAAVARADVTLGLSSPAFARMVADSPILTTRELEMLLLRARPGRRDSRRDRDGHRSAAACRRAARLGPPGAVHRGAPAQPGRAAEAGDLCRAGRGLRPGVRPAGAGPGNQLPARLTAPRYDPL
jgi:AcrR family transcriptional regulator